MNTYTWKNIINSTPSDQHRLIQRMYPITSWGDFLKLQSWPVPAERSTWFEWRSKQIWFKTGVKIPISHLGNRCCEFLLLFFPSILKGTRSAFLVKPAGPARTGHELNDTSWVIGRGRGLHLDHSQGRWKRSRFLPALQLFTGFEAWVSGFEEVCSQN